MREARWMCAQNSPGKVLHSPLLAATALPLFAVFPARSQEPQWGYGHAQALALAEGHTRVYMHVCWPFIGNGLLLQPFIFLGQFSDLLQLQNKPINFGDFCRRRERKWQNDRKLFNANNPFQPIFYPPPYRSAAVKSWPTIVGCSICRRQETEAGQGALATFRQVSSLHCKNSENTRQVQNIYIVIWTK